MHDPGFRGARLHAEVAAQALEVEVQDAPGGNGAVVAAQHVGQPARGLLQHARPAARRALQRLLRRLRALACPGRVRVMKSRGNLPCTGV